MVRRSLVRTYSVSIIVSFVTGKYSTKVSIIVTRSRMGTPSFSRLVRTFCKSTMDTFMRFSSSIRTGWDSFTCSISLFTPSRVRSSWTCFFMVSDSWERMMSDGFIVLSSSAMVPVVI